MADKSVQYTALVIKRSQFGETDQVVTLLSAESGRQSVVAKGSTKLTSSRLAALEPGTLIKVHLIQTKGMPLLTQAVVINQLTDKYEGVGHVRAITQWLELMDILFVEEEIEAFIFAKVMAGRKLVADPATSITKLRHHIFDLVEALGFTDKSLTENDSIANVIASITDKPLRGFEYLSVR